MVPSLTGLTLKVMVIILLSKTNPTFTEPIPTNQIDLENWPKHDSNDKSIIGQSSRFYYIQGRAGEFEEGKPFLKLKKDYFRVDDSLVSDSAAVSFKYWCNSEQSTHFHSTIDRSKNVGLSQMNEWTQVLAVQVNQYQWPYYEFYNHGNFTFALKDIRVQYFNASLKDAPLLVEDHCNPSNGCSNIFDRSLPSITIYSD